MRSSWSLEACLAFVCSLSAFLSSLSSACDSFFARSRCASVSSRLNVRRSCVSASLSRLSRHCWIVRWRNSLSASVLARRFARRSFWRSCSLMSFLFALVSASIISIFSCCSSRAFWVAARASSRLALPTSADFHWERSWFFSACTESISAEASASVALAASVSFRCAAICASRVAA